MATLSLWHRTIAPWHHLHTSTRDALVSIYAILGEKCRTNFCAVFVLHLRNLQMAMFFMPVVNSLWKYFVGLYTLPMLNALFSHDVNFTNTSTSARHKRGYTPICTIMQKFHADRCHRRRDICNWTEKNTTTNIPFHTNVWRVKILWVIDRLINLCTVFSVLCYCKVRRLVEAAAACRSRYVTHTAEFVSYSP